MELTIKEVFKDILNISVDDDAIQGDYDKWDSLGHIKLILAIEKKFGIRIDFNEMYKLNTYKKILKYCIDNI